MRHFVIISDWANEYERGVTVFGVEHTLDKAKEIFDEYVAEEKEYAKKHGFEIFEDCSTVFDAGDGEDYNSYHTNLYIQMV